MGKVRVWFIYALPDTISTGSVDAVSLPLINYLCILRFHVTIKGLLMLALRSKVVIFALKRNL